MNNSSRENVCSIESFKRFPDVSREDMEMLKQLPLSIALEMRKLIRQQAASDRRFRARHVTDLSDVAMDRLSAASQSSQYGAGGGRARRLPSQP